MSHLLPILALPDAPGLTPLALLLQSQFLCLAVQEGTLVLLYDFGSGLKRAIPLKPPQPLTAASKAVRQGAWGQEGRQGVGVPEACYPFPADPGVSSTDWQPQTRAGACGEGHCVHCGAGQHAGHG